MPQATGLIIERSDQNSCHAFFHHLRKGRHNMIAKWQDQPAKIPELLHQARCAAIAPALTSWQNTQRKNRTS